ncbi:MAG: CcoQ/FixQ family Cbb3-type cytochrome c oxidase assembly chaperone [Gammaproteobacteria bacterium]
MDLGFIHSLWTLFILIIFIGIVVFVCQRDRRKYYEDAGRIPLDEDKDSNASGHSHKNMSDKDNV